MVIKYFNYSGLMEYVRQNCEQWEMIIMHISIICISFIFFIEVLSLLSLEEFPMAFIMILFIVMFWTMPYWTYWIQYKKISSYRIILLESEIEIKGRTESVADKISYDVISKVYIDKCNDRFISWARGPMISKHGKELLGQYMNVIGNKGELLFGIPYSSENMARLQQGMTNKLEI